MTTRDDRGSKHQSGDNVVSLPGSATERTPGPADDPRLPPEFVEPAFGPFGENWIITDASGAAIELTGAEMRELTEWYAASLSVEDLS